MDRLRNCPFCNKDVNDDFFGVHFNGLIKKWLFAHECEHPKTHFTVTICVYGLTKEEVIDNWNGVQYEQEHHAD